MSKKRIIIAGGSGFLGRNLARHLMDRYEVINLARSPRESYDREWDGRTVGEWKKYIDGAFAVINMAGRSVDCRYTEKNKKEILDSRILSTRAIGQAIAEAQAKPEIWINSSTATIYRDTRGDLPANTEKEGVTGDDFSMNIAKAWEKAFFEFKWEGVRQVATRTSIVMGKDGGAFPVLAKLAKRGLCSPQGRGDQWISWVHVDDFCRAIDFIMEKGGEGIYNIATPGYLKNKDFNRLLKEKYKPFIVLPQPVWLLKLGAFFIGTETELVLKSRKIHPERLIDEGFQFLYPEIKNALDHLRDE